MTKKEKILIYIVLIASFLLKEEVYGFFFQSKLYKETFAEIEETKNKIVEKKYQELLNAYGYEEKVTYPLEHTKVLYRNVYDLENQITIYKGKENNIEEKNLVINEKGLVGIISRVDKKSSVVDLLLNDSLNLSVKINSEYGILKYQNQELIIEGINNKGKVEVGDTILTSNLSIYPENIVVGTIKEITLDHYEIEKKIKVTPAVDFENIKYISVITHLRGV